MSWISRPTRWLRIEDMERRYHRSGNAIMAWIDRHGFPAPVKRNGRRMWRESEIEEFDLSGNRQMLMNARAGRPRGGAVEIDRLRQAGSFNDTWRDQ